MTSAQIRQKYLDFFKKNGHAIIPSASLLPENDPTTLFTSSGMQPLVPYLLGEPHPEGRRLANSQKSFRADDIEEVGDQRHTTMFEMLGNWSLGDYFKQEQLPWFFEFLTKELELDPNNLYVTVFRGNDEIAKDNEAIEIWTKLFASQNLEAKVVDYPSIEDAEKNGMQGARIFCYPEKKNWWSRSGVPSKMPVGEPGGPDSEVFIDLGADLKKHENSQWRGLACHVNCDCGRFIELGNSVFMEFVRTESGFEKLTQQNVDFGGGLERITMAVQGKDNVFETDMFIRSLDKISELTGKQYRDHMKPFEVIADHLKAATFIMGDNRGVSPSNTDQGYIVRRLIRRAIRYGRQLEISQAVWTRQIAEAVIMTYQDVYDELKQNQDFILKNLEEEEKKFAQTLDMGLVKFDSLERRREKTGEKISGADLANLYQTYGFPFELSLEELDKRGMAYDKDGLYKDFQNELIKHQELSRTAAAGKFKGGLADHSEETTKLHTAAHLLLESLRRVLGPHVYQRGSNITAERLRFDFNHAEKMTDEQKKQVEDLVNEQINKKMPVVMQEMTLEEAKAMGATGVFESKYGEKVKVYTVGNPDEAPFSREICGGPHVENTSVLGHFEIQKEESSSAGVRRIKAVLK